jgi:pimeloyl-ACP methyl ester carboxylesterase
MKQISKKLAVAFLIFIFTLAPISPLSFIARSQVVDGSEHITGYQEWAVNRTITNPIYVDAGATLVIKKGVTITFDGGTLIVAGNLSLKGTVKENIVFKKSGNILGYSISVGSTGKLTMRNVDFSGGGANSGGGLARMNSSLINTAVASSATGINVDSGVLDVQGCNFHDNNAVFSIIDSSPDKIKVSLSKFENNSQDVFYDNGNGSQANFQYNWWGDPAGPQQTCDYYGYCYYNKLDGYIDSSKWLTEKDFHNPVIIIPGIFGSAEEDGQMQIDPVFHTYDNLYAEFANNGYTPEKDLFVFPYEWRDSNIENAKKLQAKINEIKNITNWPRVDLVAHSMGGLLAREYIESDYYGNDVDQLVTLATPNLGAPEAYMKWDGDGWFLSMSDFYMSHIIAQEAGEKSFADEFDYIHNRPVASLQEILPVYSYLYEADNSQKLRVYPNNYPRNIFLENLNSKSDKLDQVEYDKIIGNTGVNDTISGINVVNTDMGKFWVNGYPLGFEIPGTDRGAIRSNGDGAVPIDSAKSENIKSDNLIELPSDHQSIVTDAQKDVLEMLTAKRPTTEVKNGLIKNIFMAQVFSPIDIQIVAPDGKRVGKDFATGKILNEIKGAYYTGYNAESEFITIPNPTKGEYKILTEGTGDGKYKIETTEINQSAGNVATESVDTIEGVAVTGQQESKTVEVKGVEEDLTAPEAKIQFNPITQKLDILGTDNISQNVSVVVAAQPVVAKSNPRAKKINAWFSDWCRRDKDRNLTNMVATLTDEAGNTTVVVFAKTRDVNGRIFATIKSIAYNGVETTLAKTSLQYKWQLDKQKKYSQMATHIQSDATMLESHYLPKKNQTWLMEKPKDLADDNSDDNSELRPTRTKLAGMIIPALVTEGGKIKINY